MTDPTRFVPDLVRWEGSIPYMYRDSEGYVTCAIGSLIHDADDAGKIPFQFDGQRAASAKEIGDDFLRVISLPRAQTASSYRKAGPPRIELTADAVQQLAILRLEREFLPGLARICTGFDNFPAPAQSSLVDIAWNVGLRGLEAFGHMLAAVDRRDWSGAAASCHRRTSREERNAWCRDLFLSCV